VFTWKVKILGVCDFTDSVEALGEVEKINCVLIAYFLSNISAESFKNQLMFIEAI